MTTKYENTFKKFNFKDGDSIKNRVVMAPMTTWASNEDHTISDQEIKYYEKRVDGPGLIITGCTPVLPNGLGFTDEFASYDDSFIPSLTKLAKAAKSGGGKAILQIFHAGNKALPEIVGKDNIISASNVPTEAHGYSKAIKPHEMSEQEIEEVIKEFGETTRRAILAGFDGVEIHGAHGFLIQNFLSPYYNQRKDKWGGSLNNRMRFALRVVDEVQATIKKYAKKPFILGYRFSPDESQSGALRMKDTYGLIDQLVDKKVDYIHASLPNALSSKPVDMQDGDQTYLDLLVKYVDHRIPLMAAGMLNNPDEVELALEKGLDFAAVGHGIIINPDWINKTKNGHANEIKDELNAHDVKKLKLPEKLWKVIQNSGTWFKIIN